ncbi:MAG: TIGR02281 family clan AA aspartic protease, partial [Pseudomonadota bacterium]|nr:TIGR02281 family clan AA aspartic protease [Pseudomonadota bacterium]
PAGGRVLGVAVQRLNADLLGAVDSTAIRALLDEAGRYQPQPLAAVLAAYYRATPAGLWAAAHRDLQRRDYPAAVQRLEALLAMDPAIRERALPLLEAALDGLAGTRPPGEALDWLDRTRPLLGDSSRLYALYGQLHAALNDLPLARQYLYRAVVLDPADAAIRRQLREAVLAELAQQERTLAYGAGIALLEEIIGIDPDYGAWHQHLERYYREQAAALAAPGAVQVPVRRRQGVMHVEVRLNGAPQPFLFILDTGASHTVLSAAAARRLGISPTADAAPVQVNTANRRVPAMPVTLAMVDLHGAVVRDVPALILDTLEGVDGLLGLSYLRHFRVEIRDEAVMLIRR